LTYIHYQYRQNHSRCLSFPCIQVRIQNHLYLHMLQGWLCSQHLQDYCQLALFQLIPFVNH